MMLLIDTAFDVCQVGLWHDGQLHDHRAVAGEQRHDVILAPLVADLLRRNDRTVAQLTAVAVITGPGRFTSLRVGIAFARALVLPHTVPLLGVGTNAIMPQPETTTQHPARLVIVKRGEIFVQTPAMPDPVSLALADLGPWLVDHQIDGVTAIGAGVPADWDAILPSTLPRLILTQLPLTVMGKVAMQGLMAEQTGEPAAPVRPFYGQSTGAGY